MGGYWVDYDITREWPPTTPSAQPIVLSPWIQAYTVECALPYTVTPN